MDSDLQQIANLCVSVDSKLTESAARIADLEAKLAEPPPPPPPPPPPSPILILDRLQALTGTTEATGWIQPGNAGNTGGSSTKPHGTYTLAPGEVATFAIKPAGAYDNYYWYTKRKDDSYDPARRFLLDIAIQFPSPADLAASQGVEFEVQHSVGGWIWDMAWQIERPGAQGNLRTFDKVARKWIDTGAALAPAAWASAHPLRFTASFCCLDQSLTYQSLLIEGKEYLAAAVEAPAWQAAQGNYLSVGYQMDTNGSATAYSTKVSGFRVTIA